MRVSIIVPTHNRDDSLRRLLRSLPRQDSIEVIVVDDGSDPAVRLGDEGVRVICHPTPRLLAAARNTGARAANGDVLVFVDDDCVVEGSSIELLVRAFAEDPRMGIAGPVIAYLDAPRTIWCAGTERGRWTGISRMRNEGQDIAIAATLPPDCGGFPSAFAVRRTVFDELEGFNEVTFPMHMTEADIADRAVAQGYRVTLVSGAIVWHDIPSDASLARRMHIRDPHSAHSVAADRVRFLRSQVAPRGQKIANLLFWNLVLVPVNVAAILFESGRPIGERVRIAFSFLAANWEGHRGSLPRRRTPSTRP